ncbi:DNA binding domain-containing protein, excisionase family [Parapedobacter composti]|uniref:DNA binding domain-containing protein, excisionase family n=1 Tax=Parapedobacter composti TaxID=623281 RepID=A0A1I1G7A3_9SPHI|nr:helix-turn-helix domain-containing protein [Parapedobacter composti]SFC07609.1 DNA binding domain-containing protein, excisionase family [Parapedobacter composti]
MERIPFDDLPNEVALLRQEIAELKAIVKDKLTTPEGYEPDVTMTPDQVAEYLGCTVQNVHDKKNKGTLPYYKIGRKVFFKKKDVDAATKVKSYKRKFFH